jgi:hypothetical protein
MKALTLSVSGISQAVALPVNSKSGKYYAITHGQTGRGRWSIRYPLAIREFPYSDDQPSIRLDENLTAINLRKTDPNGNSLFLLAKGEADNTFMVFWNLSPGYRGSASYKVSGRASVIGLGEEAQGQAGNMGGALCPVLMVAGACSLEWTREGRLYGSPRNWVANFDGQDWSVGSVEDCAIEEAAFNY